MAASLTEERILKMVDQRVYSQYVAMLEEELVPALGCTEPIAIAFAAAKAREVLGQFPDKIIAECSGNIIKNVKGVIVPTTGDMRGIETSAILGAVAGVSDKKLECLTDVKPEDIEKTKELLKKGICQVELLAGTANLHIIIHAIKGEESAVVEVLYSHTNINSIQKNGEYLYKAGETGGTSSTTDRSLLNLADILEFANTVKLEDVKPILERQVSYNMAIANEGLTNSYGANVGSTLLKYYGDDIKTKARAYAAAGSDARMGGCVLPVVINSGSGNQGITICLPVVLYAQHLGVSEEKMYRALTLSNLIGIYEKNGLGKLSAFCGAVSAATGSGAAIAYLHGYGMDVIAKTITNTLGNVAGIVCDGAKSSCAAKIASAVDAAIMGFMMAKDGNVFGAGEGLVMDNVEETINSVSRMGREGMKETDIEILNIMIGK